MNIALVSPYDYAYPGGVRVHIAQLEKNFLRQGHRVRIIAPCSHPSEVKDAQGLIPIGRTFPVPASGSIARIALSLRLSSKVKSILRQEDFDIIHLHEPLVPALPITVLRASATINVGTFHAYRHSDWRYLYGKRLLGRWLRKLHARIAVSQPALDFISEYFPGQYEIIPNGIEVEQFAAAVPPVAEFCDGKLNILFVGRMEKRKGFRYLLAAYAQLKREFEQIRLVVVGPVSGAQSGYERTLEDMGIRDVVFVGFVPYEELPRYYKTAHVFCAPATGHESFGIVLLEAMASGKPIVASNIAGYAALISPGEEGLLVEPENPWELAQALRRVLTDPDLGQAMGEKGRQKAQDYDWKRVSQWVMNCYLRLLGGPLAT